MPPKRVIAPPNTLPGNSKGKARVVDLEQLDDDSSSNNRSREQSTLFVTPVPQAGDSHLTSGRISERKRATETMAKLREDQAKRRRTSVPTSLQSALLPRPSIEDGAVTRQSGEKTQSTSNVAGKNTDTVLELPRSQAPQGSQGLQTGDPIASANTSRTPVSQNGGPRSFASEYNGQHGAGARVAQPNATADSPVDLTGDDDEQGEADGTVPGQIRLSRTEITAESNQIRRAIRTRCRKECERAASTLEGRTDRDGREIYQRCYGTAALIGAAKTLNVLRRLMVNDVKNVLAAANTALTVERDQYSEFYENIDNILDKRDAKMILDRRTARLERVQQVQNFRKSLVLDLNDQSPRLMRLQL